MAYNFKMNHKNTVEMMLNNLTPQNTKDKSTQFKSEQLLSKVSSEWFASYIVYRARNETNHQELYSNFIFQLDSPRLVEIVLQETYKAIKILLDDYQRTGDYAHKNALLSLGHWLGLMTLANDVAIDENRLNPEAILTKALGNGNKDLEYIIPFIGKVLGGTTKSKSFSLSHPWVKKIIQLLLAIKEGPMSMRTIIEIDIVLIKLKVIPKDYELRESDQSMDNKLEIDDSESDQSMEYIVKSDSESDQSIENILGSDDSESDQSIENILGSDDSESDQSIENDDSESKQSVGNSVKMFCNKSELSIKKRLKVIGRKDEESMENQSEIDKNNMIEFTKKELYKNNSQKKYFYYTLGLSSLCKKTNLFTCYGSFSDHPKFVANVNCLKCDKFLDELIEIKKSIEQNFKEPNNIILEQANL